MATMDRLRDGTATHVYEFGVGNGDSLRLLSDTLEPGVRNMSSFRAHFLRSPGAPRLVTRPTRWFAFDSFRGLPPTKSSEHIRDWGAGRYSHEPRPSLARRWRRFEDRGGAPIDFVAGFYADSLDDGLVARLGLGPAMYVDIDCDLYESSAAALTFMLRHRLIVPGTVVGYDDWWVLPCGPGAEDVSPLQVGEGRAHAEAAARFDVEFVCIAGPCREASGAAAAVNGTRLRTAINLHTHRDSWGVLFVVASVGAGRGAPGFELSSSQAVQWKRESETCRSIGKQEKMRMRRSRTQAHSRDRSRAQP